MPLSDLNRRRLTRFIIEADVDVINTQSGSKIGSVVDIHHEGMMLMMQFIPRQDYLYPVCLHPRGIAADVTEQSELVLDCLWVRSMETPGRAWAGFRIIDKSASTATCIQTLIERFGRPDDH